MNTVSSGKAMGISPSLSPRSSWVPAFGVPAKYYFAGCPFAGMTPMGVYPLTHLTAGSLKSITASSSRTLR